MRERVTDIQAAAGTFQEHQMSDGKLGVLADILKAVSSLCIRQTTVAHNNNAPSNNSKSLKIQRK